MFLGGRYLDCISDLSSHDLYKFEILAHHSSPTTSNSFWMKQMGGFFFSSTVKHHVFIMEQPTHPRYLKFKLIQVHESNEKKPEKCMGKEYLLLSFWGVSAKIFGAETGWLV